MKGYRTIIFNIVMTLVAGGTVQFSSLPPDAQHWLQLLIDSWGFLSIVLRLLTTTPIGQTAEAAIERQLGVTPEQMAWLVAQLPQVTDMKTITEKIQKLSEDHAALLRAAAVPTQPAAQ